MRRLNSSLLNPSSLNLGSRRGPKSESPLGFGWHRDNTIGATPQQNGWLESWVEFWRDRRLGPQFELAHDRGGIFPPTR